ncbi:MAG: RdgB/HAM1 family non-canonical purine NTP pyrophosphatase [Elusimicrobiota bacterium]
MKSLLLATGNLHKIREISALLEKYSIRAAVPADFHGFPEIIEDGPTIESNARKKALCAAQFSGLWALADDTGLEVEALRGAPGIYSARYAGPSRAAADNTRKLLAELKNCPPPRKAAFRTIMALCDPRGNSVVEEGRLEGEILREPRGNEGFGYDPVFYVPARGKTLAEMDFEEKNSLSHRSAALARILPRVLRALGAAGVFLVIFGLVREANALPTDRPSQTIWDQIMAVQSNQDVREGYDDFSNRSYELAAAEFSRALAADPKNASAHMMLGAAYYWLGQVDRSLDEYRISLGLDPNNVQTYILKGISLAYEDREKEAYKAFRKATEIDSHRPDSYMDLASLEESLGKIPDALDHLRRAVLLAPSDPLYRFQLGALYYLLGRTADAEKSFRKSLSLNPQFEDAWLELGAAQEQDGDLKGALESFDQAVELKNRDSVARLRLGRIYLLKGDNKEARKIFAGAFHLTPRENGAGLELSVSYSGGKGKKSEAGNSKTPQSQSAGSNLPGIPKIAPDSPLAVFARNLERIPLDQGAVMQVQAVFVPRPKLVAASNEEPGASQLKSALQRAMSGPASGIQAVRRDYEIRAGSPQERARQIAEILSDLQSTVDNAPPNSDVHLGMNLTFKKLQETSTAPGSGRGKSSGGGPSPSNSNVLYEPRQVGNDMGLWIVGVGWMALVQETLPQPGEPPNHPDQTDWWVATGLAHAALGQGERALAAFKRAASLDPRNESALLGLGVAYVITGNDQKAEQTYRKLLSFDPGNRSASRGLEWLLRPAAGESKK